jgi:glycosyltransferase involved in cell wall biosynthesis
MQGGIADHTARLADYLTPLGVKASILITGRWQETGHSPAGWPNRSYPPPPVYPVLPNWGWRCWPAITKFLGQHQPDILHIQYQAAAFDLGGWVNWLPWYLKKRGHATAVVTTFHDLRFPYIFPKAGPFRWKSVLALARYSDGVICTDRENLHTLQEQLAINNEQLTKKFPRLAHVPLGNNVEPQPPVNFERASWRAEYGLAENALLLAYFGFLNESKGGEELIEALALLRRQGIDAHLLLIGGDIGHADPTNIAYAQRVQSLVDNLGLAKFVRRTGYVEQAEVSANLLAADAVVMPYRDGVSFRRTSLIAALKHHCPIVSTMPGDPTLIPEIRPGENMLLAPPHDAAALARTIMPLAGEPELRQKLALGAKALSSLFDWPNIAEETLKLYQAIRSHPK